MEKNFNRDLYREKMYVIYLMDKKIPHVEDLQKIKSSIKANEQVMVIKWYKTMLHNLEVFCICRTDGKQMYVYCEPVDENCSVKYFVGSIFDGSLVSCVTYEKEEAEKIFEKFLKEKSEIENFGKKMIAKYNHKTLEERVAAFGGKIDVDGEFDWGEPMGEEMW